MSTLTIITHGDCTFKPEKMPEYARRQMGCTLYDATLEWFKDPAVQAGFEKWLPEFRKREAERLAAENEESILEVENGKQAGIDERPEQLFI
jgi:hypothetical protein